MWRKASLIPALVLAGGFAAAHADPPTTAPALLTDSLSTYRQARQSGGPGKDGIPSIDDPEFQSAAEADRYLDPGDIVIGIRHNGEARAYPQRILVWHEIVNDEIGGDRIAVSYCPLTGTALGFDRGDTELGVSGKLVNSNLVMYDRATDTEYPQILAAGIDGPLAGKGLAEVRVFWTTWENWRERHPGTEVLTRDTGYMRNYQSDPYGDYNPASGYYAPDSRTMFPTLHSDRRFPSKHEIFGFRSADTAVAIEPQTLADRGVIHHRTDAGEDYAVIHDPGLDTGWVYRGNGAADIDPAEVEFTADGPRFPGRDRLTEVNGFEAMWFAWYAFYPDTAVIR